MLNDIIQLLNESQTWTLSPSERRRLSDYLSQVKATLEAAQQRSKEKKR